MLVLEWKRRKWLFRIGFSRLGLIDLGLCIFRYGLPRATNFLLRVVILNSRDVLLGDVSIILPFLLVLRGKAILKNFKLKISTSNSKPKILIKLNVIYHIFMANHCWYKYFDHVIKYFSVLVINKYGINCNHVCLT